MSFHSGRVTFCRFQVVGDAPRVADDTALATLAENAFQETPVGAPDLTESGWTTGEHLFDTQFTYEKNGFGDMLLFALRIDTHKVPSEVKQAYRRMNESAAAQENPSGFVSRKQKRDAAQTADRQLRDELAAGKYRRSKTVPVLWDLREQCLYLGAAGNAVVEQLRSNFQRSFNVELEPVTAGTLAGKLLREQGRGRDYEDLRPSAFTPAPPEVATAHHGDDADGPARDLQTPVVPWVNTAVDTKDFLGNELLLWLWSAMENDEGITAIEGASGKADIAAVIDKAIDLECGWGVRGKASLRGDGPTRLAEAAEALRMGMWPRKVGLLLADVADQKQWQLSLQADRWMVGSAALPPVEDVSSTRELVEYRLQSVRQLAATLDGLFAAFLKQRVGSGWSAKRRGLRQWISQRRGAPVAAAAAPSTTA